MSIPTPDTAADDSTAPTPDPSLENLGGSAPDPAAEARAEAAALEDKYDRMLALADLFDSTGDEMRARARLGHRVLSDESVSESAALSPRTYEAAEGDIRAATTGKHGLLTRSIELDADALVVRATVLTYRWIDELQDVAYRTLGSIAGRAIGFLAPEVALGGAIVSAGLIETDALDRDGLATYLGELAEQNPELLDHVSTGGGGLLESLQMRSLLTAGVLAGERGTAAARGGLEALGAAPFGADTASAFRDIAVGVTAELLPETEADVAAGESGADIPRSIEDLMTVLAAVTGRVQVQRVRDGRYIAYLPGPDGNGRGRRLRLVGGDHAAYEREVVAAIEKAVGEDADAKVMLVGSAQGGITAAEVAAAADSDKFEIEQVVTAGSPSSQVPRIPEHTRVLSLEDRTDPVALLGSLINQGLANRVTVVFDGDEATRQGATDLYVAGGRAADAAHHPALRAEIARLTELGYLVV
ncbi:hypothetical protein [Nocardioides alkalitolerans]|uniref:hypothetical protein n=1 Tax=Nocardioides alkalitolerans TaxID=281714 RepID=UPI0004203B70|nr:hypothetical protein [Nocardioides alkalitolerans]